MTKKNQNRESINSSLNHSAAIWKQEHITLATNLLANLNEIKFITKNIKQLSANVPDGVEENANCNNLNQEKDSKKKSIINGALNFVYYIRDYWRGDLAIGWCIYGRIIAADLLQVSLDQIPKSNNQLKSFNSELKVHQLQKYQNNGHLLRFNVLSVDLINSITPNIFLVVQLTYYTPDSNRDKAAEHASTNFEPKTYIIQLLPNVTCQCMDFLSRGGAYKHLRASVIWINWLRLQPPIPKILQRS
ncbi:hypothetical protein RCL_jg9602.t1 [Rhizophagus clarus]|uniref:Uncharacterized protein n=1 Tax=Rhizophagus clarus TaxID=94130 RepID=A0A8H3QX13_9GLOM|nr:hypothetical protein RCL_jg9602.t1 [Rhizophagus clarus]